MVPASEIPIPARTAVNSQLRLTILLIVIAAYLLLFAPLDHAWGAAAEDLSVVPVVVAGWLFGLRAGVGVALLGLPLNAALFHLVEFMDWGMAIGQSAGPGLAASVATGAGVGWLRDRGILLGAEIGAGASHESEARVRALLEHGSDLILIVDEDGVMRYVSPSSARILGYAPDELRGRPTFAFAHPDDRDRMRRDFLPRRATPGPGEPLTYRLRHKDGRWRTIEELSTVRLDDPAIRGVIINIRDVTERAAAEEALRHQALHDGLTGLPNRTLLLDRLAAALPPAAGAGAGANRAAAADLPAALLLIDLDRFKEVNDTLGHHVGDALLCQVAARMRGAVRGADTLARLGGDEFAVLLPDADEGGARRVAVAILAALEAPFPVDGHALDVGASVGVALYPAHGADAAALLRAADVAMYAAKHGRGILTVYDASLDGHSPARLGLMTDLRRALADGALEVHYQPLARLRDGHVTAAEALLRWTHPERGPIPPDVFIPLAEHSGMIEPLTDWVLDEALRQCRAWEQEGRTLVVQVNLSMRTVQDARLPDRVAELLRRHEVPPARLTLEITEGALMADPERARAVLDRLAALGVRLAIDDFGTGYSSLAYLSALPIHEVKIDKSFVQDMEESAKDAAIVRSVIALAHALRLHVVAEGIESRVTWDLLDALGCDVAQGYYLSWPLPAAQWTRQRFPDDRDTVGATTTGGPGDSAAPGLGLRALIDPGLLLPPGTPTEQAIELFAREPARAAVALGEDGVPGALVTRAGLMAKLSGLYGNAIYRARSVSRVATGTMLTVDVDMPLEHAVRRATARPAESRYDPLVVTDGGRYVGLVAVAQLLDHLNDEALLRARLSHPLTGLPGTPLLETEVAARLAAGAPLSLILADIDRFRDYNDVLGLARGDEILRLTARLVGEVVSEAGCDDDLVAHIGGDDFVVLATSVRSRTLCAAIAAHVAAHGCGALSGAEAVGRLSVTAVAVDAAALDAPGYTGLIDEAARRKRAAVRARNEAPASAIA